MKHTPETRLALDTAIWATARRLGLFSYGQLAAEAGTTVERATRLAQGWLAARAILDAGEGPSRRRLFKVADNAPADLPRAPVAGSPQGNMWRSMRMLASFSPVDVAAHSCTDAVQVSRDDAAAYCQTLTRAGYLRVMRKARPGKLEAVYRLINNTGPKPPVLRRIRVVVDQNTGAIAHVPEMRP
jgi:hypothetical protein